MTSPTAQAQGSPPSTPAADPRPIRGKEGGTDPSAHDAQTDAQNPDLLAPPRTDHGSVPNLRWPFSLSHNRLEPGGWAREVTIRELPVSKSMAGVDMRLNAGAVRELHWHKESEWSYMLYGRARITAVDQDGRQFVDDVEEGDLWFFPPGIPHSIQGLGPDGCEFLLVFDDGAFSEDSTFLITDWLAHTPREVLAKNFGWPESAFDGVPPKELYIFDAPLPGPLDGDRIPGAPAVPQTFSHRLAQQAPQRFRGGTVRIADTGNFPISGTTAAALVEIESGALRELHWHPRQDEWQYYLSGQGRMTVFASSAKARTFDYRGGDVGFVPRGMGHYIENTGGETLRYLEIFNSGRYEDVSLAQWMARTPHELVQAHLHLPDGLLAGLRQEKAPVVDGRS